MSLSLNNVQVKTALKLMLRPLGLTYKVDDEVVVITSPQATPAETFVKTYYVGDLIVPANRGAEVPIPQHLTDSSPTNELNSGARGIFPTDSPIPTGADGMGVKKFERRWVDMTPIVQLIATSIAPGTWQVHDGEGADVTQSYGLGGAFGGGDAGGIDVARPIGAITPFFLSISLIVRHTAEVHDQVADLLRQLRRLSDLQVSIEVRFITVQDNFFEQIGVDFDFQINSKSVGRHTTFAEVNPLTSLFSVPGVTGGLLGGSSGGSSAGGSSGGGSSGGGSSGGGSSGGGSSGGGSSGGGSGGGGSSGGGSGGGASGGGSSGGASGGGSSGGASGGGSSGGGGGTTGGGGLSNPYLVNPVRDHVYGANVAGHRRYAGRRHQ